MSWWDKISGGSNHYGLVPGKPGDYQVGGKDVNLNNLSDPDAIGNGVEKAFGLGPYDPANADREALRQQIALGNQQGAAAGKFADSNEGNYNGVDTSNLNQSRQYLQDLATGKNSVSALQLQQGLQSNLAAQRSMAAGVAPQNSAAAARNAANNAARLGYGYSGQQALAGLQERNQAQQQLSGLDLQRRQQDLSGALGSRQNAIGAYGQGLSAYGTELQNPQKNGNQMMGNVASSLLAMAASDRRLKTDVRDGDDDATTALAGLKAFTYKYKDEKKYGKDQQLGVMAQDLQRTPLKGAVTDTPEGKMVDGAKLALGIAAILPGLDKRLAKLEEGADEGDTPDDAGGGRDPKTLLLGLRTVATRKRKAG